MIARSLRVGTAATCLLLLLAVPAFAQDDHWPEPRPGDLRGDPNEPPPPDDWPVAPEDPQPPEDGYEDDVKDAELETIQISYTGWYVSFIDGQVERERGASIGSKVSENEMELESNWAHVFEISGRFKRWAAIRAQYLFLGLNGRDPNLRKSFVFDGEVFNIGESIASEMDFQSYQLTFDATWASSTAMFMGGGVVGLRVFTVKTLIKSQDTPTKRANTRTTIWTPTLGGVARMRGKLGGPVAIGGMVRLGFFAFPEVARQYRWAFFEFETNAYLEFIETVRLEVGMRYLAVHLRSDHSHGNDERVELQTWGGTFGVSLQF